MGSASVYTRDIGQNLKGESKNGLGYSSCLFFFFFSAKPPYEDKLPTGLPSTRRQMSCQSQARLQLVCFPQPGHYSKKESSPAGRRKSSQPLPEDWWSQKIFSITARIIFLNRRGWISLNFCSTGISFENLISHYYNCSYNVVFVIPHLSLSFSPIIITLVIMFRFYLALVFEPPRHQLL